MTSTSSVRAHACEQTFQNGDICAACAGCKRLLLRKHLRRMMAEKRELTRYTPLSRVSKARVANALKISRLEKRHVVQQLHKIRAKLREEQVQVSEDSHKRLSEIMDRSEKNSFVELFWKEQKKAFERKSGGMRWHPMMVRFAILLHSQSPSAYRSIRQLGGIKLPAESTLRDYTNVLHPESGFQMEVFLELRKMTESLRSDERWVCLMHDEITIKSDLVYDRRTGDLVGFVDKSQWKGEAEDSNLATHALVFMVVGITSNIKMSIGYFPTRTATADQMFPLLWRAIGLVECVSNLKVIASTSDKTNPNQRLIRLHGAGHKTKNLFAPERDIFFFSDAPHLLKTVRNNMASSGFGKNTKYLWNDGREILWSHVARLFQEDSKRQLRRTKLTAEHIYLTPQSVMRVYLAAQVLSHTVGSVMMTFGPDDSKETAKFILLMDKFFDCLNTRSPKEGTRKNNKYLAPYTSVDDDRFRFLSEEFMSYVERWRESTRTRKGYTLTQRKKMFLTDQTYEGLRTTVKSVIDATKFLLQSGVKMVLTNRFNQDPLEEHFGRHRCLCVRAENPSLWTYGYQENKLRMQRSLALSILPRGNIRSKRAINPVAVDDTPMPKIRRRKQTKPPM